MRKISANIIYDGLGNKFDHYVLIIDSYNKISGLIPKTIAGEASEIEHFDGFICPGFVNTHCHLELSHLKGTLDEKLGINNFLNQLVKLRATDEEIITESCIEWDNMMYQQGIIAVGDICNTHHSIKAKLNTKIQYYNFIETFALHPSRAEAAINKAKSLLNEFKRNLNFPVSITPHAPYSVSNDLYSLINNTIRPGDSITIHNQESQSENEFFVSRSGEMAKRLTDWGIDISHIIASGKNSVQTYLQEIKEDNNLLLVHNTFTAKEDLNYIKEVRKHTYLALCPKANLYIENALPNIELIQKSGLPICIGTDSLASNNDLNIWSELQTIQSAYPKINTETLIKWACLNGAKFLNMENKFGSFENKKNPGVININKNQITRIA